ncbi:MAG TPA: endolytic transglycosylase MltG, partial [Acidimicrobiales bacterium]|nr:endolytic transglycosylase MltG [Acidimicrobiales bacterium]
MSLERRRIVLVAGGALLVVVAALLVWAVVWYEGEVHAGPPGPSVVVDVTPGSSAAKVAGELSRQGVVGSSLALRMYFFFHGTPVVRPGGYGLRRNENLAAVRAALARGPDVVVVPPGFTVRETAARVDEVAGGDGAAFSRAAADRAVFSRYEPPGPGNLDGLLGTGNYVLAPGESSTSLLAQMVLRFDTQAQAAGLEAGAAALDITPYQAVVVASIVQKEGVYPQNLAKVARVVYN